jgi:hypothetical protein
MSKIGKDTLDGLDKLREDYENAVIIAERNKSPKDCWIVINGRWGWFRSRFKYSGVRTKDCKMGARKSKHKEYKAFDLKCKHMDILFYLIENHYKTYGINRLENPKVTKTWAHCEFEIWPESLKIFNP